VLYAGPGNDVLVYDATDVRVDGGLGTDTLRLDGSGLTLDLGAIVGSKARGLEEADVSGSGANTLQLDVRDLLFASDTSNTLRVSGDADDAINATGGWGAGTDAGGGFTQFTLGVATLLVDTDVVNNPASTIV